MILSDYPVGEIVHSRQDKLLKRGITRQLIKLLKQMLPENQGFGDDIDEEQEAEWQADIAHRLHFNVDEITQFQDNLTLILATLQTLISNSRDAQLLGLKYFRVLQRYVFVENLPALLITIFKNKNALLSKREIHSETLYKRNFDDLRFTDIVDFFIRELIERNNPSYIYVLRKICIIDGMPLPRIQYKIYEDIFDEDMPHGPYRFGVDYNEEGTIVFIDYESVSHPQHVLIQDVGGKLDEDRRSYLYNQLALEADICFG